MSVVRSAAKRRIRKRHLSRGATMRPVGARGSRGNGLLSSPRWMFCWVKLQHFSSPPGCRETGLWRSCERKPGASPLVAGCNGRGRRR